MALTRKIQVAAKVEATEGTAETLVAADAQILAWDPQMNFDPPMFERTPARATLSRLAGVSGHRMGRFTCRVAMRGSGSLGTYPKWGRFLQGCGFVEKAAETIAIGAISGGPYIAGETITGGTSGGTAILIKGAADGAATLLYYVVSGVLQTTETLTGSISGATSTSSAGPVTKGDAYVPATLLTKSLTIGAYEDPDAGGLIKRMQGCRGTARFGFTVGEPAMIDLDMQGVYKDHVDGSELVIDHEDPIPPKFLSAGLTVGGDSLTVHGMEIDLGATVAPREDANSAAGILSFQLTDRETQMTLDPELVSKATTDFYSDLFNDVENAVEFVVGSVSGNKWEIYAPRAQYLGMELADRNGIATLQASIGLRGGADTKDDDLVLIQV